MSTSMLPMQRAAMALGFAVLLLASTLMPALAGQTSRDRNQFPGRRVGGGTRGDCAADSRSLVALNPANNLGVTASDSPSLYFALPPLDDTYPIEFVLQNAEGTPVYRAALNPEPGQSLVGVHLPSQSLQPDQDYQWYFSVVCDAQDASQNVVLAGWLRRVTTEIPQVSSTASVATQLEQVTVAQEAGLWVDAIATLVDLRQSHPEDHQVRAQWSQLLHALALDVILDPPMMSQR